MGTVSFEVPGPGTYQVECDPKLPALANGGSAGDILQGKQFYNDQNQVVTGTLEPGTDTSDATATAGDILAPKTAYVAVGKVTGTIATKSESDVTADGPTVAVPPGYYPQAVNKTVSDPDLVPGNIKAGVEILGVTGSFSPEYTAKLVVTVEAGAVVTATDGTTTMTETSTGTVTFYLPNGGTWTVSATLDGSEATPDTVEVQENFSLALSAGASQSVNVPTQYEAELSFIPTYTVTLTIDPAGSGTVTGGGEYQEGAQATVTASPEDGYNFSGWNENGQNVSESPEYTFTVSGDRTLTAVFDEVPQYVAGVDWWESTLPSSAYWSSVTYGDGKFVAVASSGQGACSTDGINWEEVTLPSSARWRSITYGGGKFVAVAENSDQTAYSEDGINWRSSTLPYSAEWSSVTYGDGKFVVVAASAQGAYSADGVNWATASVVRGDWRGVAYGNGKFVSPSYRSAGGGYSLDGINWKSMNLPYYTYWNSIAFGDGKFVAVGIDNRGAYSPNGIDWMASTFPLSVGWDCIAYGDGKFVVFAYNINQVIYSQDGTKWSIATLPSTGDWYSVTYGNGKFVAVSSGTKVVYSSAKGPGV